MNNKKHDLGYFVFEKISLKKIKREKKQKINKRKFNTSNIGARNNTSQKKKTFLVCILSVMVMLLLIIRLGFLMIMCSKHYTELADVLHERERDIKAARGRIIDSTGTVLADNKTVCTVSVIHSQIMEPEKVIEVLSSELGLSDEYVRKRVEKRSSRERIKSNIDKAIGDKIRNYDLDGVKVDEDYKRYYPYDELASKVLGFTGGDNQGIIGLEVSYEKYLTGTNGQILTKTDAKGIEIDGVGEKRKEPVAGNDLYISIDINIQKYAQQLAYQVYKTKQAEGVSIIVMNAKNGEILAMTDVPEFDLNNPFQLIPEFEESLLETSKNKQDIVNQMWRNGCINDTYEPGSTFKIITAAAGLEEGVVSLSDNFSCPGYITVDDRRIRCHKTVGHGAEDFTHAVMNSCNPVFITVGLRLGSERYYNYFEQFGLKQKTGVDLPGEANTIMHKLDNIGNVELATISFGQSFQITPLRLMATVSGLINDGKMITPHFGVRVMDKEKNTIKEFDYPVTDGIVSSATSEKLRYVLEQVVENGGGKNGYVEGYRVGGKTATSQTLPRGTGRYIASFLGFAPADDPQIMAITIIKVPKGQYYGGQIAAPVVRQLFENILPYLDKLEYNNKVVNDN
ncbi:MAG: peptidoglycan glycosyltransferase [Lachnospiraceae bacterium]|nr:peptidoglycan glycosyltransferase [Lachnospiraceae bacterium]MBQ2406854.1 peptidoglycan glycosyltransferase [Lachnospiraceae bacterium]